MARPMVAGKMQVIVLLTPDDAAVLDSMAACRNLTRSEFVSQMVRAADRREFGGRAAELVQAGNQPLMLPQQA